MEYLFVLVFAVAFGFRNGYQFKERFATDDQKSRKYNKYWHGLQAIIQLDFMAAMAYYNDFSIYFFVFGLSAFWILFDGIVAKFLGKKFFYLGKTAFIDRCFRDVFGDKYMTASIVVKFLSFTISGFVYFLAQYL
jgi:hypothetical protein